MTEPFRAAELRLRPLLKGHAERLGSYDKLASEIEMATGGQTKVDRRKIKNLVEGDDVPLRVSELRALDAFLSPFGQGLGVTPIFDQSGPLSEIAARGDVQIFVGAFPRPELGRIDVSRWDLQAQALLVRRLYQYSDIRFELSDTLYRPSSEMRAKATHGDESVERKSIISIGSSRVCTETEFLLSRIFGVNAFHEPPRGGPQLPFYFVWPDGGQQAGLESAFCLKGSDILAQAPDLSADLSNGDTSVAAILSRGELLPVDRSGDSWTTYGVIVAQRRRTGALWAVVAGLSGPATYGAALCLAELDRAVPGSELGSHSPVQWAIVEVFVERSDTPGDPRRVVDAKIRNGVQEWPS
jgi:hypothetical protein